MNKDDKLLCCLLPNKCNLYGRPVLVHIFNNTFYSLNFVLVIYILATTAYIIWQMLNHYMKNILSRLLCQHDQMGSNVKSEVCNLRKLIESCKYNNFDIIDVSQCHCDVKHSIEQRSLKCKNSTPELESKICFNCTKCKAPSENFSKLFSSQKGSCVPSKHTNKYTCSSKSISQKRNEHFCVSSFGKQHLTKCDKSQISISNNSCWPMIKKMYNTKL